LGRLFGWDFKITERNEMNDISIQLPDAVKEAENYLKQSKDDRLKTLNKLIQPRSYNQNGNYYEPIHYEKMWSTLAKHEEKRGSDINGYKWILNYVDDAIECQKLPEYYYIENKSRIKLISEILSKKNDIAQTFLKNKNTLNPRLRQALDRKELLHTKDLQNCLGYKNPEFDIIEALEFYTNSLINDIASVDDLQSDDGHIEQNMFAIALIKRNQFLYKKDLLQIVAITMWGLFGVYKVVGTLSNAKKNATKIK
tara:strand:- start:930 stop:1691 length:762 start_codon:yes stop_codon:yes gene_type:complete